MRVAIAIETRARSRFQREALNRISVRWAVALKVSGGGVVLGWDAMACTVVSVGSVFSVRWERPEVSDMRDIVAGLAEQHRATGRRLTYVAVAPASSDPPDSAARREMPALMNHALQHCKVMHLVFEGRGFKQSIMRSVIAGVFLAGGRSDVVRVHATIEEVMRAESSPDLAESLRILLPPCAVPA